MKIGEIITHLRKQAGWSQTELATKINASREAISKYERGEAIPSVETAKKIADIFEVTLDYLVNDGSVPTFNKKIVKRIVEIDKMKEEDQKHLIAIMDAYLRDYKAREAYAS